MYEAAVRIEAAGEGVTARALADLADGEAALSLGDGKSGNKASKRNFFTFAIEFIEESRA